VLIESFYVDADFILQTPWFCLRQNHF